MAQAVHAAFQIAQDFPEIIRCWTTESNYLVIVQVPDMYELMRLGSEARKRDIKISLAVEPDFDDELTAIAFEPGPAARRLCASLPLAMRKAVGLIVDAPPKPRVYTDEDCEVWADA